MKVLVCGSRCGSMKETMWRRLPACEPTFIITLGEGGFSRHAREWAKENGIGFCEFPANYSGLGPEAWRWSHAWALHYAQPDLVLAFPGGPATRNMVKQANEAGVPVEFVDI